jgi:predicted esterase
VAADRVAVMGYSMGGAAALSAVEKSALQAFAREGSERAEPAGLRAMIAYCPPCAFSSGVLTAPALILVGERDDWIPAAACRKLAAAGLAREYAPELGIKGAVAIGVSYFTAATFFVPRPPGGPDPTLAYTLYLALFATRVDPALKPEGMLSARALPLLAEARTTCVPSLFSDVLAAGLSRAAARGPDWAAMFQTLLPYLEYPTLRLPVPLFVASGARDADVPPPKQAALVRAACDAGTTVEAHLYARRGHVDSVLASFRDALTFVRKVLGDEPIRPVCDPAPQ